MCLGCALGLRRRPGRRCRLAAQVCAGLRSRRSDGGRRLLLRASAPVHDVQTVSPNTHVREAQLQRVRNDPCRVSE
jgi:hypothetical protein